MYYCTNTPIYATVCPFFVSPTTPPHLRKLDARLFSVVAGSSEPIYQQLIAQVTRLIAAGQLSAGDTLPSVREVADAHAINAMTVSKAYAALEATGLLERMRGVGMAVAAMHAAPQRKGERLDLLRPALERAAQEARQLQIDAPTAAALFERILKETRK